AQRPRLKQRKRPSHRPRFGREQRCQTPILVIWSSRQDCDIFSTTARFAQRAAALAASTSANVGGSAAAPDICGRGSVADVQQEQSSTSAARWSYGLEPATSWVRSVSRWGLRGTRGEG